MTFANPIPWWALAPLIAAAALVGWFASRHVPLPAGRRAALSVLRVVTLLLLVLFLMRPVAEPRRGCDAVVPILVDTSRSEASRMRTAAAASTRLATWWRERSCRRSARNSRWRSSRSATRLPRRRLRNCLRPRGEAICRRRWRPSPSATGAGRSPASCCSRTAATRAAPAPRTCSAIGPRRSTRSASDR